MMRPNLQVALDTVDLGTAVRVALQVADLADRIEIGTPLLRRHGVRAIQELRDRCKDAILVADFKTMDYGHLETRLAIDAGADGVIVQAAATRATIEAACSCALEGSAFVMVDGIGIASVSDLARRVNGLDVRNIIIHRAKDEQNYKGGLTELSDTDVIPALRLPPLALAGGITPRNLPALLSGTNIDTIIIGSAIVTNPCPRNVALTFRSLLNGWSL
jgi:3-hexulose-6-phosphate synthase/6-phospho-3-hexuloisomerase